MIGARSSSSCAVPTQILGQSFDFYVDLVNGLDTNDGSESAPFKTLGHTLSQMSSGTSVGLAAGSNFNEHNLDFRALSGITLQGYGDFAANGLPLIRSELNIPSGNWQSSVDRGDSLMNVYSVDLVISAAPDSQKLVPLIIEMFTKVMNWVADKGACQSEAGSFHVTKNNNDPGQLTAGTWTFYIHPTAGDDPRSSGTNYRYTYGSAPIFGDNTTLRFLAGGHQIHRNGFRLGRNALVENVLLNQVHGVHSLLAASGGFRNVVCWQDFIDERSDHIALEFYEDDARGLVGTMQNCVFVGVDDSSYEMAAFGGHTANTDHLYDRITIRDCAARYGGINGTANGWAEVMVIERNLIDGGEIQFGSHTTSTVRDNWHIGATGGLNHFVRYFSDGVNLFEGNRTYADYSAGCIWEPGESTTMRRNVMVRDGELGANSSLFVNRSIIDGGSILSIGNIFDEGASSWWSRTYNLISLNAASDNNVFSNNPRAWIDGTVYSTLALLQGATGAEIFSVALTDPQIADAANGDFTVQATDLPAGTGLENFPVYTTIPADVGAAETQARGS